MRVFTRLELGYSHQVGSHRQSEPVYELRPLNSRQATLRVQHDLSRDYLFERRQYNVHNSYISLDLVYTLPWDVYTYLGLVGRAEQWVPKVGKGFYEARVEKDEVLAGVSKLTQTWHAQQGLFVDSRLQEDQSVLPSKRDVKPRLPWMSVFFPTAHMSAAKEGGVSELGGYIAAFNVIPSVALTPVDGSKGDREDDCEIDKAFNEASTGSTAITDGDIWSGPPQMLLTNLRAFPPSSVAHYRESQLRGDKWNNVLIAILYHPQVHICRLYADHCTRLTDTALDLEQALDHAFRNRYAEQYCASDQTFPSIDQITSQTQDVVTSSPDTLAVAATPVRSPKKRRRHASKSASIVSAHSSVSIAGAA